MSAPAADLNGTVQDSQGYSLDGARIVVRALGDPTDSGHSTATNGVGQYSLQLPAGEYELEAYLTGFELQTVPVKLETSPVEVAISLEPAGLHQGIVVTATRHEMDTSKLPLATALISSQRLQQQTPTNLAQSLSEVPGVSWRGAGAFRSRPIIRGLDSNRILILVDGERLNNNRTSTSQGGLETALVDVSDIDQVEVVRGPGSVLYGSDAFGGVINIRTGNAAPREELSFGVRLGANAYPNSDGVRANAEVSAGNRWFSARARGTVGAINDYVSPQGQVYFSGADENSQLGEFRFFAPSDQTFSFKYMHRDGNNFGLPSLDPNPVFLATFPFSKLVKFSGGYQKSFRSPVLSSIRANLYSQSQNRAFFNRILAGPTAQILSDTVTDTRSTGFDIQLTSLPSTTHVLTYGVSYYRDQNEDFRLQTMVGAGPRPIVLDAAPSVPNSSFAGTGLFFQDQFEATRRVRMTGGLRVDRFDLSTDDTPGFDPDVATFIDGDITDIALSGNIGTSIDLGSGLTVTGNVGRAFRAANLFERFFFGRGSVGGFIVPNPSLGPETSIQFDTGVHFNSGPAKFSVNYFRNNLDNLISSAPGTFNGESMLSGQPVFQNTNVREARIQGVESTAEFALNGIGSQWTPMVSAAWQRGENRVTAAPLSLIAPFVGQARLRWSPRAARLWSEFGAFLVGSSDRVPEGTTPIRGYTAFTWRVGYELARGESGLGAKLPQGLSSINLHAGVENVGNRTYFGLFESVPQPGRDFRFGIDLNFDTRSR